MNAPSRKVTSYDRKENGKKGREKKRWVLDKLVKLKLWVARLW